MPNSYTAVPNVIPGNLTVQGTLSVQGTSIPKTVFCPGGNVNHTGTTTEDFLWQPQIPPNTMPNDGGVHIFTAITSSVQGGVASTCKLYFGITPFASFSIAATGAYAVQVRLYNILNKQNQVIHTLVIGPSGVLVNTVAAATQDTTLFAEFDLSITNGATTDHQALQLREMELFETFTPV